jgi:O-antigen ligase
VALSLVFLLFSNSKTAIGLLPVALIVALVVTHLRSPVLAIVVASGTALMMNVLTVGSALFDPILSFISLFMSDPTFTARSDIWKFALTELASRPITGFGFSAFWGTERVVFGLSEQGTWATAATDAHNAYVNIAVTTGIPGLLLAVTWLAVAPLADYFKRPGDPESDALATLFLRLWLLGIYSASFESVLFPQVGELWFIFMMAVFGLRFLSVSRLSASQAPAP